MRKLKRKPRFCRYSAAGVERIEYSDLSLIRWGVSETGKILPKRSTGTKSHFQRQLATAVKRARFLALIPYTDRHDQGQGGGR